MGDEITSRKGGTFKVWSINQNNSYRCTLLDSIKGKAIREPRKGLSYDEVMECDIWDYDIVSIRTVNPRDLL
jgi:hypothetical protein